MMLSSLPQASIGKWEGSALQSNERYPMTVDISKEHVFVNYPTLPCDGEWYLSKVDNNKLTFRELIKHGIAECCQDGIIVLELLPGDAIKYQFFDNSKERGVYAIATLKRSKKD